MLYGIVIFVNIRKLDEPYNKFAADDFKTHWKRPGKSFKNEIVIIEKSWNIVAKWDKLLIISTFFFCHIGFF